MKVDIEINGEPVSLQMKLGENGEAFFVKETENTLVSNNSHYSESGATQIQNRTELTDVKVNSYLSARWGVARLLTQLILQTVWIGSNYLVSVKVTLFLSRDLSCAVQNDQRDVSNLVHHHVQTQTAESLICVRSKLMDRQIMREDKSAVWRFPGIQIRIQTPDVPKQLSESGFQTSALLLEPQLNSRSISFFSLEKLSRLVS